MNKFYFRVDANDKIGIGHMMRCFAIAKELRRHHVETTFFVADHTSAAMAADAGYGYYCLNTDYDHLDLEADRLLEVMRSKDADNLLVDSYFVTENYLQKIRQVAHVAYIDDIDRFIYPCDLLINYNIYADQLHYPERYAAAGQKTLFALGLSYLPLAEEYRNLQPAPHEGFRVLVTTGATDNLDILGNLLLAVTREGLNETMDFYCILGRYNHHSAALHAAYDTAKNIHFLPPQKTLATLIPAVDAAVTAGGTTVYELCAAGTPSVMLTLADNQMRAAKTFSARGLIPYAGDVRTDMPGTIRSILAQLHEYQSSPDLCTHDSETLRAVADGRGAERIADLLLKMQEDRMP